MSEINAEGPDLPRVTIRKGDKTGSFRLNFQITTTSFEQADPIVQELLSLADDWTSYCITSLQFIPGMAQAGFFIVDHTIEESDMAFLKELSISNEEIFDEKKNESVFSYIFHDDDLSEVARRMETTTQMLRAAKTIQRSTLSALIAEFDFFFSKFLKIASKKFPERFYEMDDTVTLSELSKFEKMHEVIDAKIDKLIRRKLRLSHADFISWSFKVLELEKQEGAHRKNEHFQDFVEVCQRRHVMAHNGGIINDEYVTKCLAAGIDPAQILDVGDDAQITARYLRRATARVYLVGYYAVHLFLQKHFPDDIRASFGNLLSTSHSFLENDRTKMAQRVIEFAEFNAAKFDHELKLKFAVNKALTKLLEPNVEETEQTENAGSVVKQYDWSVRDPIFDLALACIRRDFSDIVSLARAASSAGLTYPDAKNFVVFREARKIDGFMECFPRTALQIEDKRKD